MRSPAALTPRSSVLAAELSTVHAAWAHPYHARVRNRTQDKTQLTRTYPTTTTPRTRREVRRAAVQHRLLSFSMHSLRLSWRTSKWLSCDARVLRAISKADRGGTRRGATLLWNDLSTCIYQDCCGRRVRGDWARESDSSRMQCSAHLAQTRLALPCLDELIPQR